MKRTLHMLSRLLLVLTVMASGVGMIVVALSDDAWVLAVASLSALRWQIGWMGLALVSLAVLYIFSGMRRRRRERFLSFENDGGAVSISSDAISDYVEKLADEFPSAVRMAVEVIPRHNAVDLRVRVRARSGCQVNEMCQLMQQRVRESMVNGLGISQVRRIEVSVSEIISEHKPFS